MVRAVTLILGFVALATVVRADEAVTTAPAGPSAVAPVEASNLPEMIHDRPAYDDRGPVLGPCGGQARVDANGTVKADKKPHGVVYGGIGTRGYRQVGGVVCQPLGDKGAITVAVDVGHLDGSRR